MGKPIRLMIADDHVIMREGLKQIFALDESLSVVAEAGNGAQVLAQLRSVTPDLLLLDMSMPGISGEALISRVVAQYPRLPILVLSMYSEAQIAQHALKSGARGYITKDKDPEALLSAIRRVAQGPAISTTRLPSNWYFPTTRRGQSRARCADGQRAPNHDYVCAGDGHQCHRQ